MAGTVVFGTPTAAPIPGAQFGTGADKAVISSTGGVTLEGAAKRSLAIRPALQFADIIRVGAGAEIKPTPVDLGAFTGFSMPVFNADAEELYYKCRCPYRWDGSSDPVFKVIVALAGAEDVGDKFKFQLSWNNTSITGAIEADVVDVETETTVITDHAAKYSTYSVAFTLDYDNAGLQQTLLARNMICGRLRRIAASSAEVSNEIYVLDWALTFTVDKMFGLAT
jgi:hypothetical protein